MEPLKLSRWRSWGNILYPTAW